MSCSTVTLIFIFHLSTIEVKYSKNLFWMRKIHIFLWHYSINLQNPFSDGLLHLIDKNEIKFNF